MTLAKALLTLVTTTLLFAALGCGIGFSLGAYVPDYYRNLFRHGHTQQFDPISMGIGLGLGQGAAGGAAAGIALVAILAWYDLRRATDNAHLGRALPH